MDSDKKFRVSWEIRFIFVLLRYCKGESYVMVLSCFNGVRFNFFFLKDSWKKGFFWVKVFLGYCGK